MPCTYALYCVNHPFDAEQDIHELVDIIDYSLHTYKTLSSGRSREGKFAEGKFLKILSKKEYTLFTGALWV
jgi:hypothetical protein